MTFINWDSIFHFTFFWLVFMFVLLLLSHPVILIHLNGCHCLFVIMKRKIKSHTECHYGCLKMIGNLLFVILSTVFAFASGSSISRRNVLLIISDDLRSFDSNSVTPNIDAFATNSLNFKYAYAQVTSCFLLFHFKNLNF